LKLNGLYQVFQNASYRKLFFAAFLSQLGSVIGIIAFTFYLLDRFSTEPYYATIAEMMYSLPTLFVFFIVGVLADRMDRQKIAMYCDWINAGLSLLFLLAVWIGWLPFIFLIMFVRSAVGKFFVPAETALVQGILKKEDYPVAAGLNQFLMSFFLLFGTGLGTLTYVFINIEGAILIDAISFILSGILIRSCNIGKEVRLPNGSARWRDLHIGFVFRDFLQGLHYILHHPLLLSLILGFFLFGIVNAGFSLMPIYLIKYKLAPEHYKEISVIMSIVFGVGILLGSLLGTYLSGKIKYERIIIPGLLISGIITLCAPSVDYVWTFLILVFLAAISIAPINISIGGWIPLIVDKRYMGRVQGWINPIVMLGQSITLVVIAVTFPAIVDVEAPFYWLGTCFIVYGIYYLLRLPKLTSRS
jgi:DHA3 family macrolide efflux protein-like MFS transporter